MPVAVSSRSFLKALAGAFGIACLAIAPPTLALNSETALAQYGLTVWTTENGLPQNTVRDIIQTRDGYIWLATGGGAARFDGVNFEIFDRHNTPAMRSDDVRSLFEDTDDNIWLSTADGLVCRKPSGFSRLSTADGLTSDSVFSVFQDRQGALWITAGGGLNRYQDGKVTSFTRREGLPGNSIQAIVQDANDNVWAGTDGGLVEFRNGALTRSSPSSQLSLAGVRALAIDGGGTLWAGTLSGLYQITNDSFTGLIKTEGLAGTSVTALLEDKAGRLWAGTPTGLSLVKNGRVTNFLTAEGLPSERIAALYQDKEGTIWASTTAGLARFDGSAFKTLTTREGLSSNSISALFEDREGDLWLGTESGGLDLLRDRKFSTLTAGDGLASDLVTAIYQDQGSSVWVGTNGGGLNLLSKGATTAFTTKNGLPSNVILSLAGDRNGNLWIGTPGGLSRFHDGAFTTYTSVDGLADDTAKSIVADRQDAVWVATSRGLTRFKDGKFTVFTSADGLGSDSIGHLLEDQAGNLWASTPAGLSCLRGNKFTNYTTADGLSSDRITSLFLDHSNNLWIATEGSGLNLLRDGKFSQVTMQDGLLDDVIYQTLEDGTGRLWLGCSKGIFRVDQKDLVEKAAGRGGRLSVVPYNTGDGMKTRECSGVGDPACCRTSDGKLWFATLKGVALIDPDNIRLNELAPPVAIEQIEVDGEIAGPAAKITVPPGHATFAFHYTALSFVAPGKVQFEYRLQGFDRDWVAAGGRRVAYYTNIPPGDYTFRVIACNNDGIWNDAGATIQFYIEPHFYQTYSFYLVCAVLAGLAVWQLYLMRVRRIQSQFRAVLAERGRIAREIHDTLAQGFAGLSLQLEMVAKTLSGAPEVARTHLNQARMLVRQSLADARRSVWDLRSESPEDNDLPSALSHTARQLTANSPVKVQLQVTGTFRRMDRGIEKNLLRIGQEAVTNAVKHGGAANININLEYDSDSVRLSVQDDGKGFDTGNPYTAGDGHFGLLGMRERAEEICGTLTVNSTPGAGTTISIQTVLPSGEKETHKR